MSTSRNHQASQADEAGANPRFGRLPSSVNDIPTIDGDARAESEAPARRSRLRAPDAAKPAADEGTAKPAADEGAAKPAGDEGAAKPAGDEGAAKPAVHAREPARGSKGTKTAKGPKAAKAAKAK